jgi:cyclic dehypoxanthinyl futalosine synthase
VVVDLFSIENKISNGQRISLSEAEYLWHNADDQSLVRLAQIVRGRFHSPDIATYVLMRIINYTNICVAKCDYCAFYELPVSKKGYLLSNEAIFSKIDELIDVGGELFVFNGGFNPALKIDYYVDLFSTIRRKYGHDIEFYAMRRA